MASALDTTTENMAEEYEAARKKRARFLHNWPKMIERYVGGAAYDSELGTKMDGPVNPAFEMVSTFQAQIIAGQPCCTVTPARADRPDVRLRSIALQYALNRLARNMNLKRTYRKLFMDWYFRRATTKLVRQVAPWMDPGPLNGPAWRPTIQRVSPTQYICDARATDHDDTAWRGDETIASKRKLLEQAKREKGWKVAAIESLDENAISREALTGGREGDALKRDEVEIVWMHVPDEVTNDLGPDDGFHGTMHCFAKSTGAADEGDGKCGLVRIREPQPWWGPRRGPYNMSGMYYVPDQVEPLSVMVAIEHVAKSLAIRAAVIEQAMKDYKKFVLEGTGTAKLGMLIKNANHHGVVKARGFDGRNVKTFETGGLDPQFLAAYEFDQERMRQLSGLTEAMKGNVTAGTTATAEALAQGGAAARAAAMQDEFYDFVREDWIGLADLVDSDDQFYVPLPPEIQRETGQRIVGLQGGREKGQTFEDYDLLIDPMSMKHRSEAERIAAAERELNLWTGLAQLIPQSPWIEWPGVLEDVGEAWGNNQLAGRLNVKMATQVAALMLQQAMVGTAPFEGSGAKPKPASAKDAPAGRPQAAPQRPALGAGAQISSGEAAGKRAPTPGAKAGVASKQIARAGKVGR